MEDKTRAAMEGYVEAYTKNEKDLFFRSSRLEFCFDKYSNLSLLV